MVDTFSKEIRRKTMQAVKSKNTKFEKGVFSELWRRGFRFRRNVSSLYGKPDLAIKKYKIVVFLDSCFWHGCKRHCRIPSSHRSYWAAKISRNAKRDKDVTKYYKKQGWKVFRIWEHEIKKDLDKCLRAALAIIRRGKNESRRYC